MEVRDGRDRVVLIQCHAGDLTRQRSNAASSDGKSDFRQGYEVVIAVGSAAHATAESTTSNQRVILVVRHVAAGVSRAGKVNAGPASYDRKCSPGTEAVTSQQMAAQIKHAVIAGSNLPAESLAADKCLCNVGYTLGLNVVDFLCLPCPPGTYKQVNGTGFCVQCVAGKYSEDIAAAIGARVTGITLAVAYKFRS